MKLKKQIINYVMIGLSTLAMTACGGSSGGGSSSCMGKYTDSDGDGFHDGIDFAPNDASIPGDFSTPEKILAHPEVKKVLKIAKEKDVNVRTDLGHKPPNLTGYNRMESGGGRIVDAEAGGLDNRVVYFFGTENRICTDKERYEVRGSNFSPSRGAIGSYNLKYTMLRGSKNYFTYYSPYTKTCKNKTQIYGISIHSAKLNADGDIVDEKAVQATLYKTGPKLPGCGGWQVQYYDSRNKITNLDELEYMCVDGKNAYIPGETWKNKDKESCTCNKYVETECK